MAQALERRCPNWWGPDWLRLPVAFWVSIVASAAMMGLVEETLLRLLMPSLYTTSKLHPGPLSTGDYYVALTCALGAWPTLQLWSRALHKRGLHSWDD
jgi:hypothetical protein